MGELSYSSPGLDKHPKMNVLVGDDVACCWLAFFNQSDNCLISAQWCFSDQGLIKTKLLEIAWK